MQPLEHPEQLVDIGHVESGAVVANEIGRRRAVGENAELDFGGVPPAGKFPGVAKQVLQHHPQQTRIAFDDEIGSGDGRNRTVRSRLAQPRRDGQRQVRQIDRLEPHFAARDPRQREHAVDQNRHALRRFAHVAQVLSTCFVQLVAAVFQQRLAEAVDAAQRSPQIVRDRIAEGLQLPVLHFEFFDERRPGFGDLARGLRLHGLQLRAQQLFANQAVFILELFAPNLGEHARTQQIEVTRLRNIIIGANGETLNHRITVINRGQDDDRNVA